MTTFYIGPRVEAVQDALEQLRASRVPAVQERFDENWEERGIWRQADFADETGLDVFPQNAAWELVRAFRFAGENLLEMVGLNLRGHGGAYFDVVADIANDTLSYKAIQPATDRVNVQEKTVSWPMPGTGFFDVLGFHSTDFGRDQFGVFDSWRPNGARTLTLRWAPGARVPHRSTDSLYPDWPVGSTADMDQLASAIRATLPHPPNKHERGTWHHVLTADFREGLITLTQIEMVELEHQLTAGILPLDELVWLATDSGRKAQGGASDDFAATGIAATEITEEEVVARVGLLDLVPEKILSEDYFPASTGGEDGFEDREAEIERGLINEENSTDQDAYARSEEDGWFYEN